MSKQYRKKPVVIEAMEFTKGGKDQFEVYRWMQDHGTDARLYDGNLQKVDTPLEDGTYYFWSSMSIPTLEGPMTANVGDFIIRGVQGEFYPCKPHIFAATYEEVA